MPAKKNKFQTNKKVKIEKEQKVETPEVKEEVKEEKKEEKVMTTKKTKEEIIYGNEKSELRCVETLCIASRGGLNKGVRYFVTEEIAKEYSNNLKSI